jgi:hypothetical protein
MSLTYGYDLKDGEIFLEAPVQAESGLQTAGTARSIWRNISKSPPILCGFRIYPCHISSSSQPFSVRYIPSWVPYLSYQPLARIGQDLSERIRNEPIDFVKNALVCGDRASIIQVD